MALSKCRECGVEVSTEAKMCPRCGASKPAGQRFGLVGILLLAIGLVIIIGALSSGSSGAGSSSAGTTPSAPTHKYADAFEAKWDGYTGCKETVLASLKAPSTADVSGMEDSGYRRRGDVISFDGTVDAQNSFGAKLRARWSCRFRVFPDSLHALAFHLSQPGE